MGDTPTGAEPGAAMRSAETPPQAGTAAGQVGATPAGNEPLVPQSKVQELIDQNTARHKGQLEKQLADLTEQVTALTNQNTELATFKAETEAATLTERERLEKAAADEKARADAAEERERKAGLEVVKRDLVAELAPGLPRAFANLISGDDEDSLRTAITSLYEQWQESLTAGADQRTAAMIDELPTLTEDEARTKYGEVGVQVRGRLLQQRRPDIGAPTNAGGQAGVPPPGAASQAAMRELAETRTTRGVVQQREAVTQLLAQKPGV